MAKCDSDSKRENKGGMTGGIGEPVAVVRELAEVLKYKERKHMRLIIGIPGATGPGFIRGLSRPRNSLIFEFNSIFQPIIMFKKNT